MTENASNQPTPNPPRNQGVRLNVDRYHEWLKRLTEVGIIKPQDKPKPKASSPAKARDYSHLKPYHWTPEQMALGYERMKKGRELRVAVGKMFPSRTGYLRSAEQRGDRPKTWIKQEWAKLTSRYLKATNSTKDSGHV